MKTDKSSISKADSYRRIGEFWDSNDLTDFWDQTKPAQFDVEIDSEKIYFALDRELSQKLESVAREHGISPGTLINLWVKENLEKRKTG